MDSITLYPLIWSPRFAQHGAHVLGDLFAVEAIDPDPGTGRDAVAAFVIKLAEPAECIDGIGKRVTAGANTAIRIPIEGALERLRHLAFEPNGQPAQSIPRLRFTAVHIDARRLVSVHVTSDPLQKRATFAPPDAYAFDALAGADAEMKAREAARTITSDETPSAKARTQSTNAPTPGDTSRKGRRAR